MNSTKITIFMAIGVLGICTATFLIFSGRFGQFVDQGGDNSFQANAQQSIGQKVVLAINDGETTEQTFKTGFQEGITASDLLKTAVKSLGLELKTETYGTDVFIKLIGTKENGQDGKYWLYYVNGQMPPVSADKKELKAGDKVEFKFEKSPF